eukprot:TRINITY_DN330_c0_g1_i3.p1 TRINITY_DN330_c0_g1~~TRINITY_DN330_c0_g1_i3.p1  ORF type:complete len:660 (-),score=187.11 TRINITY_DN330_c0_g1_i3:40-1926(-)
MGDHKHLYVRIVEGRDLPTKGGPYASLKIGKEKKFKTDAIHKQPNPKWNEKGRLFDPVTEPGDIKIDVMDYIQYFLDSSLGNITIKPTDYNDGIPVDKWFRLTKKKKDAHGEVRIQIMMVPASESSITDADFLAPLQTLMRKKKEDIFFSMLEKKGTSLETGDSEGDTPLHVAGLLDLPDCAEALIKNGAPVNALNNAKWTPLHSAASASGEVCKLLLAHGAKIGANEAEIKVTGPPLIDESGLTPLHIAAWHNQVPAIDVLHQAGANLNQQSTSGNSPLSYAVQRSCMEAMKLLVKLGANLFVKNKKDHTPATIAVDMGGAVKANLKAAAGIEDDREFEVKKGDLTHRTRQLGDPLEYDWKKSQQFVISVKEKTEVCVILRFLGPGSLLPGAGNQSPRSIETTDLLQGTKTGFVVVTTAEGHHNEMSYQTALEGYGSNKPFFGVFDPDVKHVVIPYSGESTQHGQFSLLVFTEPDKHINISPLKPWKHSVTIEGQWKGSTAGGCQNHESWINNPKYALELADKKDDENVPILVMLSQKKSELDLIPYQVMAYQLFIGWYIYDHSMENQIEVCKKWRNAREVVQNYQINFRKHKKVVIVPTTFDPGQETTFSVTVFSDHQLKLSPHSD